MEVYPAVLKRILFTVLAAPLLAAVAFAIALAIRQHGDAETTVAAVPAGDTTEGDRHDGSIAPSNDIPLDDRLRGLERTVNSLDRGADGAPVSVAELQALTEELATVTAVIRTAEPGSLPTGTGSSYFELAVDTLALLERLAIAEDAEAALLSARGIAEFARDRVAEYLVETQFELSQRVDSETTRAHHA